MEPMRTAAESPPVATSCGSNHQPVCDRAPSPFCADAGAASDGADLATSLAAAMA